ncbi:MAG: hypothetical protein ACFFD2_03285 [Promethearchaeota archaeon]
MVPGSIRARAARALAEICSGFFPRGAAPIPGDVGWSTTRHPRRSGAA